MKKEQLAAAVLADIEAAFKDVDALGYEYSLADCYFISSQEGTPDICGYPGDRNPEAARDFLEKKIYQLSLLDDKSKKNMEYQIRNNTIIYKESSWKDLSREYLEASAYGHYLLPPWSFWHYMAGWMALFIKQKVFPHDNISMTFLEWLLCFDFDKNRRLSFLDDAKRKAVAGFLVYVTLTGRQNFNPTYAREALEVTWLEFAGEYREIYKQGLEE